VVNGSMLYFLRSIDPLCIVRVNGPTDADVWKTKTVVPPAYAHVIGQHRGGAMASFMHALPTTISEPAISEIVGIGRKTIESPLEHIPFGYRINANTLEVYVTDYEYHTLEFDDDVIIDPTSMIDAGIVVSTLAHSWWHPQKISARLCRLEP
jgi:hypothetical protein